MFVFKVAIRQTYVFLCKPPSNPPEHLWHKKIRRQKNTTVFILASSLFSSFLARCVRISSTTPLLFPYCSLLVFTRFNRPFERPMVHSCHFQQQFVPSFHDFELFGKMFDSFEENLDISSIISMETIES